MKNCPKCGVQLPDEAVFCNNCGENLAAPTQNASQPIPEPVNNQTLESAKEKNKNTKIGIIAVAAAVGVLVIVLICMLCSSLGNSYKTPIKGLISALNKESTSIDDYADSVLPKFLKNTYNDLYSFFKGIDSELTEEFDEFFAESMEDTFDSFADEFGDNWKITYEFKDVEELDDDELEEIQDDWEEMYDSLKDLELDDEDTYEYFIEMLDDEYDADLDDSDVEKLVKIAESTLEGIDSAKITEGYLVEVELTIEGSEDDDDTEVEFVVIKVNGQWVINPADYFYSIYYELYYMF